MTNNNPIPDAELAELRRLQEGTTPRPWLWGKVWLDHVPNYTSILALHNAFPAILARLEAVERERDELASVVKSPEYRQMLADQANRPVRDAQQRRDGAAEWLGGYLQGLSAGNHGAPGSIVAILEAELRRLREGGE